MSDDQVDLSFGGLRKKVADSKSTSSLLKTGVLALIQIAQELNEIKHILAEREND